MNARGSFVINIRNIGYMRAYKCVRNVWCGACLIGQV